MVAVLIHAGEVPGKKGSLMFSRWIRTGLFVVFSFLVSCTYMGTRTRASHYFVSPDRCSQGPFEIEVEARGFSWGEEIELLVYSPRKIAFRVDLEEEGQPYKDWRQFGDANNMENQSCLAEESREETAETGGDTPGTVGEGVEPQGPVPEMPESEPSTPGGNPVLVRLEPGPRGTFLLRGESVGTPDSFPRDNVYPLMLFRKERSDLSGKNPWPAGKKFRIRLWSTLPNDLEGVRFLVRHNEYVPKPNEQKYVEKLRKREREQEQKRAKQQREADRRHRRWVARQEAKGHSRPKKAKPSKPPKKRVYTGYATGRYKGRRVQIIRNFTNLEEYWRCQKDKTDIDCWHKPRKGRHHYFIDEMPKPDDTPRPRAADGPPPAPRMELQPPKASENAVWVPGYWRWTGFKWFWIGGFWRVPASDLEQEKTAVAPQEPPPPKEEAREAAPLAEAIWAPGYWHWNGAVFVWVEGRWMIPPKQNEQWVPPTWRRTPRGVIFRPGHWRKR